VTIRPGEPWGREIPRPAELVVVGSDAEFARSVALDPGRDFALSGGDLHRTLGSPPPPGDVVQRLPVDLLEVVVDGVGRTAAAHVVIRQRGWRGRVVAVCNADHIGRWNVAPRAHPNDGRFDVIDVDAAMSWRDRWEARRRLPTGTHVPHPAISVRTAAAWSWQDPSGALVLVDGVDLGRCRSVEVRILPDAASVHV
jgi:hypothetical protein